MESMKLPSEQEQEDVSAEFLMKMLEDIPLDNVQLISHSMQRCRSALAGRPGSGRLLSAETICPGCGAPWLCGQYRAELCPRPTATKPLRRLLNKRREGRPMGLVQRRLVDRFLAARDLMVLECKRCQKVTKLPIVSRSGRGKTGADATETPIQVTPGVTPAVTPGVTPTGTPGLTPSASGRRRSRARDKNAGLVIPDSMRTPRAATVGAAAGVRTPAAAAAAARETPELGQSPLIRSRLCPAAEDSSLDAAVGSIAPTETVDSPIPLKKRRETLPTVASGGDNVSLSDGVPLAIPLKKSRTAPIPGRGSRTPGPGKSGKGGASAATTPASAQSSAEAKEKQRRLQKILAQAECRTSSTGLMAFLSEL